MKKILLALALVLGGLAVAPASPVAAAPISGGCVGTSAKLLGDRTCFDLSDFTVTIYSGATSVFWSSAVDYQQVSCTSTGSDYWSNSAWSTPTYQRTIVSSGCLNSFPNFSTHEQCKSQANPVIINRFYFCSAAGHDYMEWFANVSSHEFLVVD